MNFRKAIPLSLLALALFAPEARSLTTGRHGHTTTLLPDGNILVMGGATGSGNAATNTGEIYFTTAAAFGTAPSMPASLSSHTATLMGNGMVLVTGGFTNGVPQAAGAIYNPLTGTWTAVTDPMNSARGGHTATLINKGTNSGKVLICGGQTNVAGAPVITNSCEIFTPNTGSPALGTFDPVQAMSSERMGHTASAIAGGRVFVSGGARWDTVNTTFTYLSTNEIYDPENNQWQAVTALSQGRVNHSAVVLNNGTILISGGYNGANKIDSPEEYWYKTPEGAASNQRPGSKGYLESAEIFDSYGGRVPVSGKDYLVMPMRVSRHAAVLSPDGKQHIYGGYGNIPPKFFDMSPTLENGSYIDATTFDTTTATINTSSLISFLVDTSLSRPVDGRIVDGDLFISKPPDRGSTSISVSNASIYIDFSTVPVDGQAIGAITPGVAPGNFKSIVSLYRPSGRVVFKPQQVAGNAALLTAGTFNFTPSPLPSQNPAVPLTAGSSIAFPLTFSVPSVYIGGVIKGSMTIVAGTVSDNLGFWTVSLSSGAAQFTSGVVGTDPATGLGLATGNVTFSGLEGTILNSTTSALNTGINATGDTLNGLSMRAAYNSTYINIGKLPYSVDKSTFVVREMVFADDLQYTPSDAKWSFGPVLYPVFNHSALLTPAADAALSGGRNCEANPATDCKSGGAAVFTASNITGVFISQNMDDWPETGKLLHKRAFHTSTLLPDGRILTCGGSDGTATLSSCELFNPVLKTWTDAGSMISPRSRHTATLLPNGRVLAVGGTVSSSTHAITTAEIYYPDTDRWISVNPMTTARANHTATLLPDGNVLVAGGDTINGYANTAEIFVASSTVWIPIGNNMAAGGRAQHTATLLKNGNVLVTGGINGAGPLKTAETYNFVSRTWSNNANDLNVRRYGHAANLLLDGRVMVSGGSDGFGPLDTAEIISDQSGLGSWRYTTQLGGNNLLVRRANHRATLLPNGKLMLTGGEEPGLAHSVVEGYDVDFSTWQFQGLTANRANHTAVLTSSGVLMAIGGWNGSQYLDSVQYMYFSYSPDAYGFPPQDLRNPVLSTATALLDRGGSLTLLGNTSNFHNVSEASGGGAGSMNSSFHNPRVYIQQIDNPSGFLTDLTTRLYALYGGPNTDWQKTVSSITVTAPASTGELPYGWYNVRVAANGQFSAGVPVQIAQPRPAGAPGVPVGSVLGTSSITWTWSNGGVASADGYTLYASSDGVFITTAAFGTSASYTQKGLQPNTEISVKVNAYNMGGGGPLAQSATYYTLASTPTFLTVTGASFNTATLEWNPDNNSPITPYEVSMCAGSDFGNPLLISTPVPFVPAHTSTSTTITRLSANTMYYFRVRAMNGDGRFSAFTPSVSTITVAAVNNLTGTAISTYAISWAWTASSGADYYELFDIAGGTEAPVFVGSTTYTDFNQSNLGPNAPYAVGVHAVKTNPGFGPVPGPMSYSKTVYTLAVTPSPDPISPFTEVSTGSFTANWVANANSTWTYYGVLLSTVSTFPETATSSFTTLGESIGFTNLDANRPYYVKVAAINGDGIPSAAASLGYVYTWVRPPLNVVPAAVEMSGVTLTWEQNGNSPETIYEVRGTTVNPSFTTSVATYLPFADLFTGSSLKISGLLTSTTYYFQVTACNGEGVLLGCTGSRISARTQAVPPAFTVAGPNGAPAGSIGGTAVPTSLTTIHGWLPNTREVTLTVPAGSFPQTTAIAISSSNTSACGGYTVCGRTVEVAIYSENGAQPQVPVTLDLGYECTIPDTSKLVLARYNPVSGQCLPLETRIDPSTRRITATLNHFSVFQLMVRNAASGLSDVQVYPNPFRPNRGEGFVTIANMPAAAKVRVYTLSGDKVWEGTAGTTGVMIWRGVNKYGYQVASGVYLAVIDSSAGKKVFKLAVER